MQDSGDEKCTEKSGAELTDNGMARRQFLQRSAATVAAAGLGLSGGSATAQMGSVPAYADFVPDDERLVLENDAIRFSGLDLQAYFDLLSAIDDNDEENDTSETTPFQFESQVLAILTQRENPALPVKDEHSDALSESRTEQGGSESRKLCATMSMTVA